MRGGGGIGRRYTNSAAAFDNNIEFDTEAERDYYRQHQYDNVT